MRDEKIARIGDLLAIPFFLLAFAHYSTIREKTWIDYILLCFFAVGMMVDSYLVFSYYQSFLF